MIRARTRRQAALRRSACGSSYLEVDAADIAGRLGDEDGGERGGGVRDGRENLGLHGQRVAILVTGLGGLPLPLSLRGTGLLVSRLSGMICGWRCQLTRSGNSDLGPRIAWLELGNFCTTEMWLTVKWKTKARERSESVFSRRNDVVTLKCCAFIYSNI